MRILGVLLLSMWIIGGTIVTHELPAYYQEIEQYNQIGEEFTNTDFILNRENGEKGFTEYILKNDHHYFQEIMLLVKADKVFNTVFIHKEPITKSEKPDIEINFQDFKARVHRDFGAFKPLNPRKWRNAWIYEIKDQEKDSLAAISMQLDQDDGYYLFVVIYMSQEFLEDNREVFTPTASIDFL